jgi:S1-C subfamily serine protease
MKPYSHLLSGALGGLIVLVAGAILISTDVIDVGDDTTSVVRQAAISRPAANSPSDGGHTVAQIYKEEGRGVVYVQARGVTDESSSLFGLPQEQQGTATGSGFLVDDQGTILTNAHVVEGSNDVTVSVDENQDPVKVEVKGRDPDTDLAVLKVDPDKLKNAVPVPLGDSSSAQVGDPVVAIGNPFGFTRTVTTGIVSAVARRIDAPNGFQIPNVIQTDASINPGNSGGPLMDADGRVIGINSQIATGGSGSNGSVGIGFAIPINTAKTLLPKLREGTDIKRAYLGIEMARVTKQLAEDLNLASDQGALVTNVVDGGPADKAGLHGGRTETSSGVPAGGDLIVEVDGQKIATPDDVSAAIAKKQPGDTVSVTYYRGDDKRTAKVKLGDRPAKLDSSSSSGGGGGGILPQP